MATVVRGLAPVGLQGSMRFEHPGARHAPATFGRDGRWLGLMPDGPEGLELVGSEPVRFLLRHLASGAPEVSVEQLVAHAIAVELAGSIHDVAQNAGVLRSRQCVRVGRRSSCQPSTARVALHWSGCSRSPVTGGSRWDGSSTALTSRWFLRLGCLLTSGMSSTRCSRRRTKGATRSTWNVSYRLCGWLSWRDALAALWVQLFGSDRGTTDPLGELISDSPVWCVSTSASAERALRSGWASE